MNPGTLPGDFLGVLPDTLVGYMSLTQYNYLMGLAGIISALLISMIWSRGL